MIESFFQIIFVVVMSIGILGLPLYFFLLARKRRLIAEYENDRDENSNDDESITQ